MTWTNNHNNESKLDLDLLLQSYNYIQFETSVVNYKITVDKNNNNILIRIYDIGLTSSFTLPLFVTIKDLEDYVLMAINDINKTKIA